MNKVQTHVDKAIFGMDKSTPYLVGLHLTFGNNDKMSITGKVYYNCTLNEKLAFYKASKDIVFLLKQAGATSTDELVGKEVELFYDEDGIKIMDIKFI